MSIAPDARVIASSAAAALVIAAAVTPAAAQCEFVIERQGPTRITTEPARGRFTAVAAGYRKTVASRADGSSATWGSSVVLGAGAVDRLLSASDQAILARREVCGPYVLTFLANGTAYLPTYPGYATTFTANVRDCAVSIDTAALTVRHRVIVGVTGDVRCDGLNYFGSCDIPVGLANVVEVGATSTTSAAITATGRLVCWGQDVGFPVGETSVVQLESAWTHAVARRRDGSLLAWGTGPGSQGAEIPGTMGAVVQIAAGGMHNAAVLPTGEVRCWGSNSDGQCDVPVGLADVIRVACGFGHTVALHADGSIVTWGSADGLVRGVPRRAVEPEYFAGDGASAWLCRWSDGELAGAAALAPPPGLRTVREVATDGSFAVACRADGTVACWGANDFGQCDMPANLGPVDSVDAGWRFAGALGVDGSVSIWGQNTLSQATVPAGASPASQLDLGAQHAGVVRHDGSVLCWGNNSSGQTNPVSISDAVEVRCGQSFTVVRRASGAVTVLGDQRYRPLTAHLDYERIAASPSVWIGLRAGGAVIKMTGGLADQWSESIAANAPGIVSVSGDMLGTTLVRCVAALPCPADLTRDGMVGGQDLALVLSHWGQGAQSPMADINRDGSVDASDLSEVLAAWGPCG